MSGANDREWLEFHPRASSGRRWTGGLGVTLGVLFLVALVAAWGNMPVFVWIPFAIFGIVVTGPLLALAWYFPSMRYWLGPDELVLSYGPLLNDRIPLDQIKSIRRRTLRLTPISSFRFPGLALFYVDYMGMGRVRMCASSATREILLIDIGERRYGLTPGDQVELVRAIRERSAAPMRISENFNPERVP